MPGDSSQNGHERSALFARLVAVLRDLRSARTASEERHALSPDRKYRRTTFGWSNGDSYIFQPPPRQPEAPKAWWSDYGYWHHDDDGNLVGWRWFEGKAPPPGFEGFIPPSPLQAPAYAQGSVSPRVDSPNKIGEWWSGLDKPQREGAGLGAILLCGIAVWVGLIVAMHPTWQLFQAVLLVLAAIVIGISLLGLAVLLSKRKKVLVLSLCCVSPIIVIVSFITYNAIKSTPAAIAETTPTRGPRPPSSVLRGPTDSSALIHDEARVTVVHHNNNGSTRVTTVTSASSLPRKLIVVIPKISPAISKPTPATTDSQARVHTSPLLAPRAVTLTTQPRRTPGYLTVQGPLITAASQSPVPSLTPIPMAHLRFSERETQSSNAAYPYALEVTLQTDLEIPRFMVEIVFDGPIFRDVNAHISVIGASMYAAGAWYHTAHPNSAGIRVEQPPITAQTPVTITVVAKQPLHVIKVEQVPYFVPPVGSSVDE